MLKSKIKICALSFVILTSGCAGAKEAVKGFVGVSTKVLEDGRGNAIKKDFGYDLAETHSRVKKVLLNYGAYIYSDDLEKNLIAVYVSEEDTTPVGIFLIDIGRLSTRVCRR